MSHVLWGKAQKHRKMTPLSKYAVAVVFPSANHALFMETVCSVLSTMMALLI